MNNLNPEISANQKHILRAQQSANTINQGIKGAVGIAGTALGFAGANRILPFMDKLIPTSLAIQGLKKVDKRLGQFIDTTLENGFSADTVLDFLRDKFITQPEQEATQERKKEKEHPNITQAKDLETQYPEIINALMGHIQNGQPPQAAAALLKHDQKFVKDIKKIEKDTGKNFVDLILELMGPQQQQQPNAQMMQPQAGQMAPNEMMQMGMQPQEVAQPQSQIDPKLLEIISNVKGGLNRMLGRG